MSALAGLPLVEVAVMVPSWLLRCRVLRADPTSSGTGGQPIGQVVIDETDDNAVFPNANIGFDTIRLP